MGVINSCRRALFRPWNRLYSSFLNNRGVIAFNQFQQFGQIVDLDNAIIHHRASLALRPPGDPIRSTSLNNLAAAIVTRYEETGVIKDLEEAIIYLRQSLDLLPSGDPNCATALDNLAFAILSHSHQTNRLESLEEAISYHRRSLDLRPPGHPDHAISLSNFAAAIRNRFEQTGRMEDLEEAIGCHRRSLVLHPLGHPERASSLSTLAVAIFARFEKMGKMDDLEEAITYHREALLLRPPGHLNRSFSLNNLADVILTHFKQTGRMEDLEESITYLRQSLVLRPTGHPHRSTSLNILADAILTRFKHKGTMDDLEEAIEYHRESLILRAPGHLNRPFSLSYLAVAIITRFEQTGRTEDLEEAIMYLRQSLELRPLGHPDRATSLNNLGVAIHNRFERMQKADDLEEAITYLRQSLDLSPLGHPDRPLSLFNLSSAIFARFEQSNNTDDLHDAAKFLSDAEASLPPLHPMHSLFKLRQASIHIKHHKLDPDGQHLSMAFSLFEVSANHHTASVKARFAASLEWASAAREQQHGSIVRAYSISLTLLVRYLVQTPTVELQQKFLASTATVPKALASDAASSAIKVGKPDVAVEFLEQGRALIWSEMRGLRHPLEQLRIANRELADQFERLSSQLEHNAMSSESEFMGPQTEQEWGVRGPQVPSEVKQQQYRVISEEWNRTVERIRQVVGFADFLKAVPFSALRKAAVEGPVLVVNISRYRCDAIIVRDTAPPVVVPLPEVEPDNLARLSSQFANPRASHSQYFSKNLCPILQALWHMIVLPVTERLAVLGVAKNSRIWWCPTSHLCALPLHAAGPYKSKQTNLPDLYISSYTSTLSVLIAARSDMAARTAPPNLLVIAQPESLQSVMEEVRRIHQLGPFVDALVGEEANRSTVIDGLQRHTWAHFACHGHRNTQPFHSSFELYSGEHLKLLDLIRARIPNAEHAFLSACHAAAGDIQGTPDEVLHLAAALQFCGFRSVVGTLWAMADIDGPDVAEDFYRHIFRQPEHVADFRDSAKALNKATRAMRRRQGMTLGRWVNFVHIGA